MRKELSPKRKTKAQTRGTIAAWHALKLCLEGKDRRMGVRVPSRFFRALTKRSGKAADKKRMMRAMDALHWLLDVAK